MADMYTPRGELDDRILMMLEREEVYHRLAGCRDAKEVRQTVDSLFSIEPDALEESLTVICSYLAEMRLSEALEECAPVPIDSDELDLVAGGGSSGEAHIRAALTGMMRRNPALSVMLNSLLMKLQE